VNDREQAPRAATIFDVARLAGVSHQTVSRVVNDLPNVRASTRERVEKAIAQLRYAPSPAARALVTRRSRLVGLVVTSGAEYGPSSIALHANEAARAQRYSVLTITMMRPGVADVRQAIESLIRQNVEGIVLVAAERALVNASYDIAGVPLVTVDPTGSAPGESVAIDQYLGARLAVRHLLDLGHRSVVHLAGPEGSLPATGLGHGDWSPGSGYAYGRDLAVVPGATAVFAANDPMALGLVHALDERGLTVPGDVSVVGFDDVPEAAHFLPPLTTVRQDFEQLGALLMARLLGAIEGERATTASRVAPSLLVRASTAPAAAGTTPAPATP
jgi:DNA-binding LacI/PurR family transcriptional regulator